MITKKLSCQRKANNNKGNVLKKTQNNDKRCPYSRDLIKDNREVSKDVIKETFP